MATALETELVRLRTENAELRAGLEARTQENVVLLQMITDVISTLKLDQVLRHIVAHLVSSFGCHAAFVYLRDSQRDRLVLRGASDRYRHFIGRIEMAPGEGLVGWSALTRKPVMLRERAMEDPRFRYFPELEEEQFQAMLTVPMTGADGNVVAVISMHTVAPQEFTEEHVRVVGALAPILGSAIETSELYENTARKLGVLSAISGLVQTVRSGRYLDDALRSLAETTVRVTGSHLCALVLVEPGLDRLSVRAYGTDADADAAGMVFTGAVDRQPWAQLAAATSPAALGLADLVPATDATMTAPLIAAGEQLGLMICYSTAVREYADDDVALLNIIANQAAIAVKNSHLADLLAERDVPARLFRDLLQGPEDGEDMLRRRAALLGWDLARAHAPVVMDFTTDTTRGESRDTARLAVARLLRQWLIDTYPGSLVHVDSAVLALIRPPSEEIVDHLPRSFEAFQSRVEREIGLRISGGVGRLCRDPVDYRRGFAEAREALRVARAVCYTKGFLPFDGLGATRYLTRITADGAGDEISDRYQDCVASVARHDARKGTTLLHTLETYLSCGGSIARTAEALFVHRNTLVQRLEKLHDLLGFDPHDSGQWLALHIALSLQHLRET